MRTFAFAVTLLFTVTCFAQGQDRRENKKHLMEDVSAEDIANLKSKKMTLMLDLSDQQEDEIYPLLLEQAQQVKTFMSKRKAAKSEQGKKPSKEELIKMQTKKLDAQIHFKRKMKSILNAEQYAKFEKMMLKRGRMKGKKKGKPLQKQ